MSEDRYLICQVGQFSIAIGTDGVNHIEEGDVAHATTQTRFDCRDLLHVPILEPGVAIALRTDETNALLIVDAVRELTTIAESEFAPLPSLFGYAKLYFDGACQTPIHGQHPLRLKYQLFGAGVLPTLPS